MHQQCKLLVAENVTTGTISELSTRTWTEHGLYTVRCIHTAPSDTGHGAVRRFRGWTRAQLKILLQH